MAKKPAKTKAPVKGAAHHQRQARKHARHRPYGRLGPLVRLAMRQVKRLPPTLRLPGVDHDIATVHAVAFVLVLGVAIGAGYWGANALFGRAAPVAETPLAATAKSTPLPDVILPESNGHDTAALAYEEKVAEEVYVPTAPPPEVPRAAEPDPMSAPDTARQQPEPAAPPRAGEVPAPAGPEVASLPSPDMTPGAEPLWRRNALDVIAPSGPMVAIVIDDMGVDRKRSRHMWEDVPGPLTLSFLTYAEDLPAQTRAARARGHELMLHVSMEPANADIDPGPNVLRTALDDAELKRRLEWGLGRFEGFVGVNNHMGSRFTEDPRAMRVVLDEIHRKGLLFLDSRTSAKSVAGRVGRELNMPVLERNVFLDNDNDVDKVLAQLRELERLAQSHGSAIAIGHPRDATLEVLKTWIPEAQTRGISIVPLSLLMKLRQGSEEGRG